VDINADDAEKLFRTALKVLEGEMPAAADGCGWCGWVKNL